MATGAGNSGALYTQTLSHRSRHYRTDPSDDDSSSATWTNLLIPIPLWSGLDERREILNQHLTQPRTFSPSAFRGLSSYHSFRTNLPPRMGRGVIGAREGMCLPRTGQVVSQHPQ